MTGKLKRYLITTKSHEIVSIRSSEFEAKREFCPVCNCVVDFQTFDKITTMRGDTTLELIRLIESGSIHSIEMPTGHLLICLDSLERRKLILQRK